MSCDMCAHLTMGEGYAYRWKNANLEVRGCIEHVREFFDFVNAAIAAQKGASKP